MPACNPRNVRSSKFKHMAHMAMKFETYETFHQIFYQYIMSQGIKRKNIQIEFFF